ncbi:MAG: SPOR domain-containing protein [Longimicrobiales bacterium]
MRAGRAWVGLVVAAALVVGTPAGLRAQDAVPVRLETVDELAASGRTEEARAMLMRWWDEAHDSASRRDRQRALWLRGRLTVDPAQADLDYRRLVIEYPGGDFSDQALFRLAQAAHARGDGERARELVERLRREYPNSNVGRDAGNWLQAAGPPPAPPTGSAPPASSTASTGQPAAPVQESAPAVPASGDHAVQLGAFSSEGRARTLKERADAAGFPARLVRVDGSQLLHVRVGRFDSMESARDLLDSLRGAGFTAALVRDADLEEPVGS